jgi:hypothetical protein
MFNMNGVVKVLPNRPGERPRLLRPNKHGIMNLAHDVCIPGKVTEAKFKPITLPDKIAELYLNQSDLGLPIIRGIWPDDGVP